MDMQKAAGSMFMCRLCNLFSPSRSLLLDHCSELHPQQEPSDDIIIALQPLVSEPVKTLAGLIESPVKRKRGRPKGSTKKSKADSSHSLEDNFQRQDEGNKKEGDSQSSSIEGESHDRILGLDCRDCHRSFSNRRQILKHICMREQEAEEDEEDNGRIVAEAGVEGSGSLEHANADPNKKNQNTVRPETSREKDMGSLRSTRTNRSRITREGAPVTENKKSVISVVLTEDETLPGVFKMVPVEDCLAETESTANKTQPQSVVFQSQSQDLASESTISEGDPETDQEPSSNPTFTTTTAAANRGFQEYSIKQDASNLLQSQLKIFTCEFCNKIFKFRHSLVAHLRTHTQEKPFQCPHCDYASAIKANLNVHLRKHTGEKFSCQHCPFNCLSPGHLKVHIERVHLKVKQHCSFCEKKYSDVKNLLKHIEKRHNLKEPTVYQSYQQLRLKTRQGLRQLLYHCSTCKRRFKNQLERERHLLVHGPQRPFACLLCDHAATKIDALAAHVRKHLFLYVCCVCDGKLVSAQRLRSHLKESHPERDQEQAFTDCINNSYYLIQPGGDMCGDEESEDTKRGKRGEHGTEQEGERNGVGGEEREHEREEAKAQGECAEGVQVTEGERRKEGEIKIGCAPQGSQDTVSIETSTPDDVQDKATAGEPAQANSVDSCTPATENTGRLKHNTTVLSPESIHCPLLEDKTRENTHAAKNTKTTSSSGNENSLDLGVHTPSSSSPPGAEDQTPHSEKESDIGRQSAFQQVFSSLQKTPLNVDTFQKLRKTYGDLECQYCGKLFWYKVQYNVHVRTHTKEHLHYCTKCSYSSITKSSLKRHQIQKHSGLLLPCSNPGCKYTTPDKYKLQAHLRTHQEQGRSVACPICQLSFTEQRLKHHIKTSHPGLKPYLCSVCDYAGRSRSNLKTHMNRHNTDRPHLCDLCGKKFKSKATLKSHRQSHTKEGNRFKCSECDFTSVSKPSLLRHKEQHAEFKPFRCAHCHYSCNLAGPLKRHYSLKHPDQKYENAGPGLPNAEALKRQGGKKCPDCEFVYRTKWEMNRHLKSKHSQKVVEDSWEAVEAIEAQYVTLEDEEQLTETPVAALHDNVDIQQITEFSSETHDAVTSMVAMAPGTVTVVQQLQVADEQEVDNCSNQLMVVNAEGDLTGDQVMVVEDAHGLEALTVLTQGDDTHHYIVYVQEHTVEINQQC
ncbi:zinc finger protein ZFAT isoform X2 [Scophthalmus maximus]|uniref:zinc finger protein ZFAT isoform X2 n=1 Tax=Scophthalmus maximus TaxID=52904 RepID=UPI001FA935AA|nr:zinc finger protein ZFAT isoform X2 [Scophthalmus maximus]